MFPNSVKTYFYCLHVKIEKVTNVNMIHTENEMLSSLDHPHIVKLHACYVIDETQQVYIMDYLEGGDLLKMLREKKRINEDNARIIFNQLVSAMDYVH